jgi:hypothetical protein
MATMMVMEAEGWFRDPFEIHSDRWISDGRPTALVRDGAVEGHDPPPEAVFSGSLVESTVPEAADGDDLRRADNGGKTGAYDPKKARQTVIDSIPWGPVN